MFFFVSYSVREIKLIYLQLYLIIDSKMDKGKKETNRKTIKKLDRNSRLKQTEKNKKEKKRSTSGNKKKLNKKYLSTQMCASDYSVISSYSY